MQNKYRIYCSVIYKNYWIMYLFLDHKNILTVRHLNNIPIYVDGLEVLSYLYTEIRCPICEISVTAVLLI
jgi:hypothetical protein